MTNSYDQTQASSVNSPVPTGFTPNNIGQSNKLSFLKSKKVLILLFFIVVIIALTLVVLGSSEQKETVTSTGGGANNPSNLSGENMENGSVPLGQGGSNFIVVNRGSLKSGESVDHEVPISESKETWFYLTWVGTQPDFSLTKPDGTEVDTEYVLGNLGEVNLDNSVSPPQMVYKVYLPTVGTWKINITANGQVDYQTFATVVGAGNTLTPSQSGTSGGGRSNAVTPLPSQPTVTQRPSNNKVSFTGQTREIPVDADGDGLYEYLQVFFQVNSGDFTEVEVKSTLGMTGNPISETLDNLNLKSGLQEIFLTYYGSDFLEGERDGPYIVTKISINPKRMGMSGEQKENIHTTSGYRYTQFEDTGNNL